MRRKLPESAEVLHVHRDPLHTHSEPHKVAGELYAGRWRAEGCAGRVEARGAVAHHPSPVRCVAGGFGASIQCVALPTIA